MKGFPREPGDGVGSPAPPWTYVLAGTTAFHYGKQPNPPVEPTCHTSTLFVLHLPLLPLSSNLPLQNRRSNSFHPPVFVYLDINWFKGMLPKHRFEQIGTFLLVKASRHYQNSGSKIAITPFFPLAAHVLSHHHEYPDRVSVADFELLILSGTTF